MSKPIETHAMSAEPRPGRLYIALSIVVIGECLCVVSLGIAGLTVTWEPCAMLGGLMIIPLPALLGLHQYVATFKRRARSATVAGVLAYVISALPLTMVCSVIAFGITERYAPPLEMWLVPLASALPFFIAGYLNLRWCRRLVHSGYKPADQRPRFSVRELLVMTGVIAAMLGMTLSFMGGNRGQFGVDVPAEESGLSLPTNAARVSFAHGSRGTIAFEFDTDEASFRQWVADGIGSLESRSANVPIEEIRGGHTMMRFYYFAHGATGPDEITINDGLIYTWSNEDRGVQAAFDRTTNRAYYFAHFH